MDGIARKHPIAGMRLIVLGALAAFATLVPTASADTGFPVWTCRASAGYVELDPLLNTQRAEPVLANGFPDRARPDTEQCATQDTGVQSTQIPPNSGTDALLTLEAASASTKITPQIAPARSQVVSADAGIAQTARVNVAGLVVTAEAITAEADGSCVNGAPQLTGSSKLTRLTVNGTTLLDIPGGTSAPGTLTDVNLSPLLRIRTNQTVQGPTPASGATPAGAQLTQRAVHIEVLQAGTGEPLTRIVLGEAKVDFHGNVCAPPPPPPTCPEGFTAQPNSNPLSCVRTVTQSVTAPCPAGSMADPKAGGACVITRTVGPPPCPAGSTADPAAGGACIRPATPAACPAGTTRDPRSQACILPVPRPCPLGATPDPATQVCVLRVTRNTQTTINGRVGSSSGPAATCGRLQMRFVRGSGRTLVNRLGTRVVTRGRLVACGSNRPIVGARIDVIHKLPDGRNLRKTGLRSRSDGRLTLILPNDLRSRRIEYAYRPNLTTTRVSSRVTLSLTVKNGRGRVVR